MIKGSATEINQIDATRRHASITGHETYLVRSIKPGAYFTRIKGCPKINVKLRECV